MLDRLESLGLLDRDVNSDDRRSFVVTLTSAGRTTAEAMQKFVEQTEKEIAGRVSKRDIEGFFAVMKAVGELTSVEVRPERPRPKGCRSRK
jgi:DNA-binding MarR family transcriptional regulator